MARAATVIITTAEAPAGLGVSPERIRHLLENGMLAGAASEVWPEPAMSISTAREPRMTGFCSRFRKPRELRVSTSTIRRWIETDA